MPLDTSLPLHPFVADLLRRIETLGSIERQALGDFLRLEARGMLDKMPLASIQQLYETYIGRYRRRADPLDRQTRLAYRLVMVVAAQLAFRQLLVFGENDEHRADMYLTAVETIVEALRIAGVIPLLEGLETRDK
jgi:hypothetical protein